MLLGLDDSDVCTIAGLLVVTEALPLVFEGTLIDALVVGETDVLFKVTILFSAGAIKPTRPFWIFDDEEGAVLLPLLFCLYVCLFVHVFWVVIAIFFAKVVKN